MKIILNYWRESLFIFWEINIIVKMTAVLNHVFLNNKVSKRHKIIFIENKLYILLSYNNERTINKLLIMNTKNYLIEKECRCSFSEFAINNNYIYALITERQNIYINIYDINNFEIVKYINLKPMMDRLIYYSEFLYKIDIIDNNIYLYVLTDDYKEYIFNFNLNSPEDYKRINVKLNLDYINNIIYNHKIHYLNYVDEGEYYHIYDLINNKIEDIGYYDDNEIYNKYNEVINKLTGGYEIVHGYSLDRNNDEHMFIPVISSPYYDYLEFVSWGNIFDVENSENYIILKYLNNKKTFSKNLLIERSKLINGMFKDIDIDGDIEIDNEIFKNIDVYYNYVKTGNINFSKKNWASTDSHYFETVVQLFYICNYLEDIDLEHVAYFMSSLNEKNYKDYDDNSLLYMTILYETGLREQYYTMLKYYIIFNNISLNNSRIEKYINFPFYDDMINYLSHKKEEYILDNNEL